MSPPDIDDDYDPVTATVEADGWITLDDGEWSIGFPPEEWDALVAHVEEQRTERRMRLS